MPTSPTPAATSQPPGRLALFLFLGVLVLSTPQAALLPLLDRDEPRFAEASREMLQGGNYVVPTFNGAPRYAKPPLIYWAQAASFAVLGENAFAARLPSLLATAGTAVLLLFWGTQLGGISVGLIAGVSYAFCLQTMQQGRVATADALLIFFTTLAAFVGWRLFQVARENRYWKGAPSTARWRATGLLLACSFALGFLAKGPEALLPMMPCSFSRWAREPSGKGVTLCRASSPSSRSRCCSYPPGRSPPTCRPTVPIGARGSATT